MSPRANRRPNGLRPVAFSAPASLAAEDFGILEPEAAMPDTILEYMATKRPKIAAALRELAQRRGNALEDSMAGGRDLMSRLLDLCLQGKMIRGCLVFLGRDVHLRLRGLAFRPANIGLYRLCGGRT